jgi:PTH1 family peptidyl-tRNA hydrolase
LQPQFMIVGLGNPGKKYQRTRHNIGFMVCDHVASIEHLSFHFGAGNSLVSPWKIAEKTTMLVKPLTYMNRSGEAIYSLLREFTIPLNKMLVISDDINLPLGTIRLKPAGSSGGHNGLQSVIDALQSEEFPRMRIGVAENTPVSDWVDFVLSNFKRREMKKVNRLLPITVQAIQSWLIDGVDTAMNNFNKHYDVEKDL